MIKHTILFLSIFFLSQGAYSFSCMEIIKKLYESHPGHKLTNVKLTAREKAMHAEELMSFNSNIYKFSSLSKDKEEMIKGLEGTFEDIDHHKISHTETLRTLEDLFLKEDISIKKFILNFNEIKTNYVKNYIMMKLLIHKNLFILEENLSTERRKKLWSSRIFQDIIFSIGRPFNKIKKSLPYSKHDLNLVIDRYFEKENEHHFSPDSIKELIGNISPYATAHVVKEGVIKLAAYLQFLLTGYLMYDEFYEHGTYFIIGKEEYIDKIIYFHVEEKNIEIKNGLTEDEFTREELAFFREMYTNDDFWSLISSMKIAKKMLGE